MNITIQELIEPVVIGVNNIGRTVIVNVQEVSGDKGNNGKSAYQSYLDTTTDNPILTETEWADGSSMTIESNW
jgi:hypothetical protein